MNFFRISLFGRFSLQLPDNSTITSFETSKVQELFCYLLCHRDRPHHRELLASLLWGDKNTEQAKRYLRKVLWQLQHTIQPDTLLVEQPLLSVDADWVQINPAARLWLDIAVLEEAYIGVRGTVGEALLDEQASHIKDALACCQGYLLEGYYHNWCLLERERLHHMHLGLLDKMMRYHETQGSYEEGIGYGEQILRHDHARERTHRSLMRLYCLSRNRTGALRQYRQCETALQEELGVEPSHRTQWLHQLILEDQWPTGAELSRTTGPLLGQLKNLSTNLSSIQSDLDQAIEDIEINHGNA